MRSRARFERIIQRSGIILIKYWLSISDEEQERRFKKRIKGSEEVGWKLEPDGHRGPGQVGRLRGSEGRHVRLHRLESPRWVVEADDKPSTARMNLISHLLTMIPTSMCRPRRTPAAGPRYVRRQSTPRIFVPTRYEVE